MIEGYTLAQLSCIALCVLLVGMQKGGFPIGGIALPALILLWPDQMTAARSAVGFMLPLLCAMDIVALSFYRKHISWPRIAPLVPGTLVGVAIGTFLLAGGPNGTVHVSDRGLKAVIGVIGILFVLYRAGKKWITRKLDHASTKPNWRRGTFYGLACGFTSTLAHAGGPPMQMYLLPQKLDKMDFAGTMAAFFWGLNLSKVLPYYFVGSITLGNLRLAAYMIPVIPVGVGLGYLMVKRIKQEHYIGLIYVLLFVTSALLVAKAFG